MAFCIALMGSPVVAQDSNAGMYVFTLSHSGSEQLVRAGEPVQVQLPVGVTDWVVGRTGENREPVGEALFASPGRVPGVDAVQIFNFVLPDPSARSVILIQPRPAARKALHNPFVITLMPITGQP